MKYFFSFLLSFVLFGCSSPAAHTVKELGNAVTKCCTSLSSIDKKPANLVRGEQESNASGLISVSIFEIDGQLIRTW